MTELYIIAHNIRSTHNVGALFRSAECFGVKHVILSGYTPYPVIENDSRLPHLAQKIQGQIHKTALGTELLVPFSYFETPPLDKLKSDGFHIAALEQDVKSIPLHKYTPPSKLALLLGEEREGIAPLLLKECESIIEIPMLGTKESLNVSVAAGIALYQLSLR